MRLLLLFLLTITAAAQADRKATLDQLLQVLRPSRVPPDGRINAVDRTWEEWIRRTGELPPDFDAMPSIPGLPDPLAGVKTGSGSCDSTPPPQPAIETTSTAAAAARMLIGSACRRSQSDRSRPS